MSTAIHPKYDKELLKSLARGHWPTIFATLANVPVEVTDGMHHPCPKCGGSNRFRAIEIDAGGLICNQCFNSGNGDGIAALEWLCGWSYPESLRNLAGYLNVSPMTPAANASQPGEGVMSSDLPANSANPAPVKAKNAKDPELHLAFRPWPKLIPILWCEIKTGTTPEALALIGTRFATYAGQHPVFSVPAFSSTDTAAKPSGWVILESSGGTLPDGQRDASGQFQSSIKVKMTGGSSAGLVNAHALRILSNPDSRSAVKVIWKAEGITDLLALQSLIPVDLRNTHLVISNSDGAGGHPDPWMLDLFALCDSLDAFHVIHDCDTPGQNGAIGKTTISKTGRKTFKPGWCQRVRDSVTAPVKNVVLPFPISENHGKDVRDWINELNADGSRRDYQQLLSLADGMPATAATTGKAGSSGGTAAVSAGSTVVPFNPSDQPEYHERQIVGRLLLTVLGEFDNGKVKVFAGGQTHIIPDIAKLSYERILQICGEQAKAVVNFGAEPEDGKHSLFEVRQSIALLSGLTHISPENESGAGIWRGKDASGNEGDSIIVVNAASAGGSARWHPQEGLTRITEPLVDGLVLDLGTQVKVCPIDELTGYIEQAAGVEWCEDVISEFVTLLERWTWRHQYQSPTIVTGMVLATLMQKMWDWRPHVFLIGESNTGKSFLFTALEIIFGKLARKSSGSSAVGIQQEIGSGSFAVMIDEFEESQHRSKIYEALRGASRGDNTFKGTITHKSKTLSMCICGWVASTESGLQKEQDINRFILAELLPPSAQDHGKLSLPHPSVLQSLGQRLLAIAIRHAAAAVQTARDLKPTHIPGVHPRMVENFSAPVAILASAKGMDLDSATDLLRSLLRFENVEPIEKNHDRLLRDILSSHVPLDHGEKMSVAAAMAVVYRSITESTKDFPYSSCRHDEALQQVGIRVLGGWRLNLGIDERDNGKFFIAPELVTRFLLKGTEWEKQNLLNHLLRISGACRDRRRVNRVVTRGVTLSIGNNVDDQDETESEEKTATSDISDATKNGKIKNNASDSQIPF